MAADAAAAPFTRPLPTRLTFPLASPPANEYKRKVLTATPMIAFHYPRASLVEQQLQL